MDEILGGAKGASLRMTPCSDVSEIWLAVGYGDDEFQGGVGGAEAGDFDVGKAGTESGTADVVFGDGFLSLGINDPESGGIVDGAGGGFDAGEIGKRIDSKENPGRRGVFFANDCSTPPL